MDIEALLVESLQLLGLGMGAVFVILILLIGVITLVAKIVPPPPPPAAAPIPANTPATANHDHVAAITAAIREYRKTH